MTYDEWIERYKPIQNTHAVASYDGTMFETYGAELEQVQATDAHCIWTLADSDGREIITSGFHLVNRIGFFITALPFGGDFLDVSVLTDDEAAELQNEDDDEDALPVP